MIYYLFLAIVDIGWYLWENKINLSVTLVASGVGVILGKRIGARIAINYIMRTLGLHKKPVIEQQVAWLIEQERGRGNIWSAERRTSKRNIIGQSFRLRWVTTFRVLSAKLFTHRMATHQLTLRGKRNMKWLKPDKLTIILGVLITAANEYFGWTLDTANVGAFFFMLFTFFKQQEIIKIVRYANGLPVAFKINSTKLVFTVLGVLIVALDQVKGMGLGLPEIITIAGFVSGYNIKEGNEDVKKSEAEAQGNQFH